MKKTLSRILTLAILCGMLPFAGLNTALSAAEAGVVINQVYGAGTPMDGAISHSFIELYNTSDQDVNLDGYSIQMASSPSAGQTTGAWNVLPLTGESIKANSSFLIVATKYVNPAARYAVADGAWDMDWDIEISNRSYSVALVANQTALSDTIAAGEQSSVLDLVGVLNEAPDSVNNSKGNPVTGVSKQKSARRVNFRNTGDNAADFEVLDYRASGISDSKLAEVYPRYSGDGAWGQDIEDVPENQKLVFSKPAGMYADEFNLTLTTGYTSGIIRYTTDGTNPTDASPEFPASLRIKDRTSDPNVMSQAGTAASGHAYNTPIAGVYKGTVVKAQVFAEDGTPLSGVVTNSYFVNPEYKDLPVFSISTDQANLFDADNGIYHANNVRNSGSDWERPAYLEMFESGVDGAVISTDIGIRIHGAYTRDDAQKALRIYARAGSGWFEYDIFQGNAERKDGTTKDEYKRFILRSGGNDKRTFMRDAMLHDLAKDLYPSVQAYRQSVVFINGEFWGIYNMRERYDEYMLADTFGIADRTKVGMLTNPGPEESEEYAEDGADPAVADDQQKYWDLWDWFNGKTTLTADDYQKAQTFMDVDSFIDSYIAHLFGDNRDWPGNNQFIWRYRTEAYPSTAEGLSATTYEDGRWRWTIRDADQIFNIWNSNGRGPEANSLTRMFDALSTEWDNAAWSTLLFRKLTTNQEFVNQFVNRYCDIMNTYFEKQRILDKINEMAGNISGEPIAQEDARWPGVLWGVGNWENNVSQMKAYVSQRQGYVLGHLKSTFKLQDTAKLTVTADPSKGTANINAIPLTKDTTGLSDASTWSGTYFKGMTQTLTASPKPGYKLEKFIVNGTVYTTPSVEIPLAEDTSVEVVFASDADSTDITVNGHVITPPEGEQGSLALTLTAEEVTQYMDNSGIFKIEIPKQYTNIVLTLPLNVLDENRLGIKTDFGVLGISDIAALREKCGDTLRLLMVKGSFKIALLDENGKEIPYIDPSNPFVLSLPYTIGQSEAPNAVVATGKNGKVIPLALYKNDSVVFNITETGTYDVAYKKKSFNDTAGHWAVDYIDFVTARSLYSGIGNGLFGPDNSMTRSMFAQVLASLEGVDLTAYTTCRFTDVPDSEWYAPAVEWAAANSIVSGVGDGKFAPEKDITREQMAQMLVKYMKFKQYVLPQSEKEAFSDESKISAGALDAVKTVQAAGIVGGKPGNLYDPQGTAKRAEVATIFTKFITLLNGRAG